MAGETSQNEGFVLELIDRFRAAHPNTSVVGLSVMSVDDRKIVLDALDMIPVRDEFIIRARQFRARNNAGTLSMDKRIISGE
jgi:hypothetical protein